MFKNLIGCALALVAASASAAIPSSQRNALISLYEQTDGASWHDRSGWLGAAGTECSWYGVRCNEQQTTVVALELNDNNLSGALPPAIGSFPDLQSVYFDRNALAGPIPPAIGQLTKLELIHLDGNRFTSIPPEIANLTSLEEIDFSYNEIEGPIPDALGQLSNLRVLRLDANFLEGSIPSSIGGLVSLQRLSLGFNSLSGTIPAEISLLSQLVELDLLYNRIEGPLPPAIAMLQNLESLELGGNLIAGPIPPQLGDLTSLRYLSLFANRFEGPLPLKLLELRNLQTLDLSINFLSGPIPGDIGQLSSLTSLSLGLNAFSGSIPSEIGLLTDLITLDLSFNELTGQIPPEIGGLRSLYYLDLALNELSGPIPDTVGEMRELGFFSVYENQLDGPIPATLGNLTNLQTLYLTSNRLTGPIPDSLRNLTALQAFYLGGNQLTGEIPTWIGELTELTTIFFPGNHFTGVIPPSIGQLTNLQSLYLGDNRLTGSIPREIGNLTQLGYLSLENNEIGGPIPLEFWQLSELVEIRLNDMALSGSLPPDIGNLDKAVVLLLDDNQLEGTIPPEIGDLESVQYLSLGANRLSGPIPRELGRLDKVIQIDLYANALRGPIPPEITGMTSLDDASSDFSFNALTADPATLAFINQKQQGGDLLATQTLTPTNVRVVQTTDRSAILEWDPIRYATDPGGYQVTVTTPAGATVAVATTASKEATSIVVRNLDASAAYRFSVATVTHPHDYQKNLLVSDPSPVVSATTSARVIAPPDVVITESATGLIQIDGAAVNDDAFTLTNFGDTETSVTLIQEGDFFTVDPQSFTLGGGASQRVVIRSVPQPPGSYYGFVDPEGTGVGNDVFVGVTLLSTTRPAGTVIAEALSTRIEVAGAPGSDSIGQARFRNRGTAPLSGILLSDQPWVVPATDPITIHPNEVATVNFTVVRSRRPPDAVGALSANLSLVYVNGSTANAGVGLKNGSSGVNVTLVTVVDVPKPPVAPATLPGFTGGELAWFAPGIASFATSAGRSVSDVSMVNAGGVRSIDDLRLYFTPVGGQSAVATLGAISPAQSLSLANVVTSVYGAQSAVGTLQFRTSAAQSLGAAARLITDGENGSHTGAVPVFRSDRAIVAGDSLYLTGLRKSASLRTDLFLQETAGAPASVSVTLLTAAGGMAAAPQEITLEPFRMVELRDVAPAGFVTAIVTNGEGSDGRIVAYARISDETSGETWSVADWSRFHRYSKVEPVRIPFVNGSSSTPGGGRRRAVAHGATSGARTEVSIFNPAASDLRARLQLTEADGRVSTRDIVVPQRHTAIVSDAGSGAATQTASMVVTPLSGGELVVSARSSSGSGGTAVPVIPATAGLRLGQSQRFAGLSDSTAATVAAARPGTFRTSYGFVETAGRTATVRARVSLDAGRDLVSAIIYRDFVVAPGQQVLAGDLVRSIIGGSRDQLGELANLQLHVEVIGGSGAVVPFVIVTENASGDTMLRLE